MQYILHVPAHLLPWLPVAGILLGLLLGVALAFLLGAPALLDARGFLAESFADARGRADGKLLTLALVAFCVAGCFVVGWASGKWPPEYIWTMALLFLAAGYGFSTFENRSKIKAESDVAQARATGQPVPGEQLPAPAAVQVTMTNNPPADATTETP